MEISRLEGIIEAILFTMGDSVELSKIASAIGHDEETTRKVIHNMMDKYENKNAKNYKVYKDFEIDKSLISDELIKTIDDSLRSTYGIVGGGKIFDDAFLQLALFMRVMKYDKTGIKRVLFDAIDPITKGSKSFSYHRDYDGVLPSLNLNHEEWLNPTDGSIISVSYTHLTLPTT